MQTQGARPRVAIITGGSRGIGRHVAARLASRDYAVVINYAGSKQEADTAAAKVAAGGGTALAIRADVADDHQVTDLFDAAERAFGGVDVVVHAACVMHLGGQTARLDPNALDETLRADVRGAFVVDHQAARRLRPGGALINFSGFPSRYRGSGHGACTARNDAVEVMTLVLAHEMRGRDVTVNAIAPAATEPRALQQLARRNGRQVRAPAHAAPTELNGMPHDIAEIVAFLAGPGRWINGQVFHLSDGTI
jgi:3-oxoacyl-[acyl-carrier protein] reductase